MDGQLELETAAGDMVGPPRKITSLQSIIKLSPPVGKEWNVVAYCLNKDMINEDGTLDDLHGVVFPLGSFKNKKDAENHAKKVIEKTGHSAVVTCSYAYPVLLKTKIEPEAMKPVPVDVKGKLIKMEDNEYKREHEEYEKRVKLEREMIKEAELETDKDNVEHFKRQSYLAVKNYAAYEVYKEKMEEALANYEKRKILVRDHYKRHPEHEKEWLPMLKQKLSERGENKLYEQIKGGYERLRPELLNIINCECPGGVCKGEI